MSVSILKDFNRTTIHNILITLKKSQTMPYNQIFTIFENCTIRGHWEDILPAQGLSGIAKKAKDDNSIIHLRPKMDDDKFDIYFSFREGTKITISGNVLVYNDYDAISISPDEYNKRCNY